MDKIKTMTPKEQPTKIAIEAHGIKFSAELPWDATVDEMMEAYTSLMIGVGYLNDSVESWIVEKAALIVEGDEQSNII